MPCVKKGQDQGSIWPSGRVKGRSCARQALGQIPFCCDFQGGRKNEVL